MSDHTDRDVVWSTALHFAITDTPFDLTELQTALKKDVNDFVVNDTLCTMSEAGWLSNNSENTWTSGPQLQKAQGKDGPDTVEMERQEAAERLVEVFGEASENKTVPEEQAIPISECDLNQPSDLSSDKVYSGVVDRICGNGNAIVDLPGNGEINLGPIDEAAEHEEVRFKPEDGVWGRCLDDEYLYDSYKPRDGASPSSKNISQGRSATKRPWRYPKSKTSGKSEESQNLNKLLTGTQ